jgi:hypothetical protein
MIYNIQPKNEDVSQPRPFPFPIDDEGKVLDQDFWQGDPYSLLGFQATAHEQRVSLFFKEFTESPQQAVGMFPVFVKKGGGLYSLTTPVEYVQVFGEEES